MSQTEYQIKPGNTTSNSEETSAFLNKETGKVTLGMTGTNLHKGAMFRETLGFRSPQDTIDMNETLKDFGADVNIGLHSVTDKDPHFKGTQDFIKNIKKVV